MEFDNNLPEWKNTGTEPNEELKQNGFQAGYKPPAGLFNWFWNRVSACINELKTKLKGHADDKNNPHEVTAEQLNAAKTDLTNIDNDVFKNKSESAGIATDVYRKDETCADETLNLFNCETPNNIFEQLGGYWWKRRTEEIGMNTDETTTKVGDDNKKGYFDNGTIFYYADAYELINGLYTLTNPSSVTIDGDNNMTEVKNALRGRYFITGQNSGAVMNYGYYDGSKQLSVGYNISQGKLVISYFTIFTAKTTTWDIVGEYEYVHSTERNKYPDSGKDGIFSYSYLGKPFENAREAPKIVTGSYKGTGTFGENAPNTIMCNFKPKLVIIDYENSSSGSIMMAIYGRDTCTSGMGSATKHITWNDDSFSWYSESANSQYNYSDRIYYYVVMG